ncbi:MAG: hypothetical protein AB1758_24990 [Candidatus Eremiobacterota bacterium]
MKNRIVSLLFVIALSVVGYAAEQQTLVGTFVDLEWGDYAHITIRDARGEERSLWVGNDDSFKPVLEKPSAYKGKKVRVTWHTVTKDIPEAGGKMEIDEATSIELVK